MLYCIIVCEIPKSEIATIFVEFVYIHFDVFEFETEIKYCICTYMTPVRGLWLCKMTEIMFALYISVS